MLKIEQLEAMPIAGNALGDSNLFELAHEILHGEYPTDHKLRALTKIDQATGSPGEINEEAIEEYRTMIPYE